MRIIAYHEPGFQKTLEQVSCRGSQQNATIEVQVKRILQAVERRGDAAICRYVKKFDGLHLRPHDFLVRKDEIEQAYQHVSKQERQALQMAAKRIRLFHERQRVRTWVYAEKGVKLGQRITPLDVVGLYVPGGKALYPSTVLMNAIPAKVAGVERVMMCTPTSSGTIHPYLLVAADIADVDEIYRIGGIQAIGAMAYGTSSIPKTDKIVGPGNMYVATAKRVVYGTVDIDMIAGPSELLVLADDTANPVHCAADLLCEAEHDEAARVYLVTPSVRLAKAVVKEMGIQLARLSRKHIATYAVKQYAWAFVTSTMEQAFELVNAIAAEHLALLVKRPFDALKKVRHAGAVFVGRYTPPAVADYVAGPNHVLPTGGSARFFSALSLDDYVKKTNIVAYNKKQLKAVQPYVTCLAGMEGLQAHARSIESRNL